jgi:hypothetical protein
MPIPHNIAKRVSILRNKIILILRGIPGYLTPGFLRSGRREVLSEKISVDEGVVDAFVRSQIANPASFNANISPEDWIMVKLVSSSGEEQVIGLDSMESMLLYPV